MPQLRMINFMSNDPLSSKIDAPLLWGGEFALFRYLHSCVVHDAPILVLASQRSAIQSAQQSENSSMAIHNIQK